MAALDSTYITLLDVGKRSDVDESIMDVIEILSEMSPVARTGYAEMCNNGTKHRTTLRASIPSPTWVQYYSRINPVKSTTRQVEDTTGMLENMSSVDQRLLRDAKEPGKIRLQEALAILEGFAQEIESTFFYGNTGTSPLEFLGLAPRMNSTTAENGAMIIDGGGVGADNTSVYACTWGPMTGHLLYPENSAAGVKREDKGVVRDSNANGVIYYAEEKFEQQIGFTMRDWRYFGRIANIDVSNLTTANAADLIDLLTKLYYRFPQRRGTIGFSPEGNPVRTTPVLYCNATILEHLDRQARTQPNRMLTTIEDVFGREVLSFRGWPIYESDGITNAEAVVS